MASSLEHLAFPVRIGPTGELVTVEQESDEEIEGCMATCLLWPAGTRELEPDFGVPDQAFVTGGADLSEIRTALQTSEPRAIEAIVQNDAALAAFVSDLTIRWDRSTSGAEM